MRITRAYIKLHPEITFIYGDTHERDSHGGQASESRGEKNAYAVATKIRTCYNDNTSFLSDHPELSPIYKQLISSMLDRIPTYEDTKIMVFPKLGKGFNEMDKRSPRLRAWMIAEIRRRFNGRIINIEDVT